MRYLIEKLGLDRMYYLMVLVSFLMLSVGIYFGVDLIFKDVSGHPPQLMEGEYRFITR